jgi:CBS domain-containing protein
MLAKDIMTSDVAFVTVDAHVSDVARLLIEKGISAVPVVDADYRPIGMISEGDLICSDELDRDARRQWWLAQLAEGQPLDPEFLATVQANCRTVLEVMTAPVVSVAESAELGEIAQLIEQHKIKRVPVVRDGRMIGLVSRADIVRAIAAEREGPPPPAWLTPKRRRITPEAADALPPPPTTIAPTRIIAQTTHSLSVESDVTAQDFRALVKKHESEEQQRDAEGRRLAREIREQRVKKLAERRLSEGRWRELLESARQSAASGTKEFMLICFPSQLCTDGGRAINAPDPAWPSTLRGEPADIFARWRDELKPRGFQLAAQIISFPEGMPGDAALFLIWES